MITLQQIVDQLGGVLFGDPTTVVQRISSLEKANEGEIAFLANSKYRHQLTSTNACAVILSESFASECNVPKIVTSQPYLYFARLAQLLSPPDLPERGINEGAYVRSDIPNSCTIEFGAVIEPGCCIGERVIVRAGCYIGKGVTIGEDSNILPNVTIYAGCQIGKRALIHSGAVIGSDGFGFARETTGEWVKIPQTGCVRIGDDVEIGANTSIDRGALEDTIIGNGVKLDNQIQIAHNVQIGDHTAMAGCVGVAGSAVIGKRCTIGGGAIILGHISLADDVHVSAGTLVSKSIKKAGSYTGTVPFMPHEDWLQNLLISASLAGYRSPPPQNP